MCLHAPDQVKLSGLLLVQHLTSLVSQIHTVTTILLCEWTPSFQQVNLCPLVILKSQHAPLAFICSVALVRANNKTEEPEVKSTLDSTDAI